MSLPRTTRITAIVAAVAVAVLGFLPAEHVHSAGTSGFEETVIHRHVGDADTGHESSVDHSDHSTAPVLAQWFETTPKFSPIQPLMVTAVTIVAPDIHGLWQTIRASSHPIHAPPLRRLPPRAPPADA